MLISDTTRHGLQKIYGSIAQHMLLVIPAALFIVCPTKRVAWQRSARHV